MCDYDMNVAGCGTAMGSIRSRLADRGSANRPDNPGSDSLALRQSVDMLLEG